MKIIKNYYSPTPVFWRKIGDFALLLILAIQPTVQSMPVTDIAKYWIGWTLTIGLISVKFWTNTKKVH